MSIAVTASTEGAVSPSVDEDVNEITRWFVVSTISAVCVPIVALSGVPIITISCFFSSTTTSSSLPVTISSCSSVVRCVVFCVSCSPHELSCLARFKFRS